MVPVCWASGESVLLGVICLRNLEMRRDESLCLLLINKKQTMETLTKNNMLTLLSKYLWGGAKSSSSSSSCWCVSSPQMSILCVALVFFLSLLRCICCQKFGSRWKLLGHSGGATGTSDSSHNKCDCVSESRLPILANLCFLTLVSKGVSNNDINNLTSASWHVWPSSCVTSSKQFFGTSSSGIVQS